MNDLQILAQRVLADGEDSRAIQFGGRWRTWKEVREVAGQVQSLIAASGVAPNTSALLIARNIPSALAAFLALIASGQTVRFVYSFQSPSAIAKEIFRIKPGVVIAAEKDCVSEIIAAIAGVGAAAVKLGEMSAHPVAGLEQSTVDQSPDMPAQPSLIIQTSGTTGSPKSFPISYDLALRKFVDRDMPHTVADGGSQQLPTLLYMSMGNLSGIMSTLPSLVNGREMILYDRFNLDGWRDYARHYRPSQSALPPVAVQMLLDADVPREELASLRGLTVGSAPLSPELHRSFEARYGIPVLKAYGATEFYGAVAAMTLELHPTWGQSKFGSVGRALAGVELRIVDAESGAALPFGEQGLLEVRQDFAGTAWIRTSDLALLDQDGFLFVIGRADGAINRGGFKVLPETIEQSLMQHDAIAAVAVVAIPDRRVGQVPGAAVQFAKHAPVLRLEDLEAYLRTVVPATHIPVHWLFVENFPMTPSMKIDRGRLAQLFEDSVINSRGFQATIEPDNS